MNLRCAKEQSSVLGGIDVSIATFIYDADCGICRSTVRFLQDRSAVGLDFRTYQQQPSEMRRAGLTPDDCRQAAYVVAWEDGFSPKVYRGASAVNYALRSLPGLHRVGWRSLGSFYAFPVIRQIEDICYAWVARNRSRLGRPGQVCAVRRS